MHFMVDDIVKYRGREFTVVAVGTGRDGRGEYARIASNQHKVRGPIAFKHLSLVKRSSPERSLP